MITNSDDFNRYYVKVGKEDFKPVTKETYFKLQSSPGSIPLLNVPSMFFITDYENKTIVGQMMSGDFSSDELGLYQKTSTYFEAYLKTAQTEEDSLGYVIPNRHNELGEFFQLDQYINNLGKDLRWKNLDCSQTTEPVRIHICDLPIFYSRLNEENKKIRIDISGSRGVGKTSVTAIIKHALKQFGVGVTMVTDDPEEYSTPGLISAENVIRGFVHSGISIEINEHMVVKQETLTKNESMSSVMKIRERFFSIIDSNVSKVLPKKDSSRYMVELTCDAPGNHMSAYFYFEEAFRANRFAFSHSIHPIHATIYPLTNQDNNEQFVS